MNLALQCTKLSSSPIPKIDSQHEINTRLVCPEYSTSVNEVKKYTLLTSEKIFFLCWDFQEKYLNASIYPSLEPFFYQFSYTKAQKTQLHTHDYIELGYIVRGTFKQRICEKDISFHEGEFFLIDKNCIHQDYLTSENGLVIFFGIENHMYEEILNENIGTEKIVTFLKASLTKQKEVQQYIHFLPIGNVSLEMETYLSQLINELFRPSVGSSYICKGLLLRIFKSLSTDYEISLSQESTHPMSFMVFEEVCNYIETHYRTIQTRDLMKKFHFQKDYFNRLIKKYTGMTYSEYLQDIRLKKAEQLLLNTDMNVTEIAEQVGYQNKGYFYKIFIEKYGVTPRKYKKR